MSQIKNYISVVSHGCLLATTSLVAPMSWAQLEEIVVTAEFREKSLMDTAMSITAFDSKRLQKFRMQRSNQVAAQTPNVEISEAFGLASPRISIRGVVNADFGPQASTPVTIYSDGVVLNNPTVHGFAMFDLDRVEVLRGPQGTLYGRNATTGSINFISARPTDELSGYAEATAASFGQFRFEGAIAGPISQNVSGRLAVVTNEADGWVENTVNGSDGPRQDDKAIRGILNFDLSEDVSVFLKAQYAENDGDASYFVNLFSPNPVTGLPNPFVGDQDKAELDLLDRPENIESLDLVMQLDWDLGGVNLTSVTGYNDHDRLEFADVDFSALPILHENFSHTSDQFSQEFRLTSDTEGQLSWIAGLYYMKESIDAETRYEFFTFVPSDPVALGQGYTSDQDLTSIAGFVQLDYQFSERWSGGLGIRYTEDEKEVNHFASTCYAFARSSNTSFSDSNNIVGDCPPIPGLALVEGSLDDEESWDDVSGSLSLQYRPSDAALVYATISRGFKGGAYNLNTSDPRAVNVVDPETLTAYELGMKWESDSRDIQVSGSFYFYDYEDLQQFIFTDLGGGTISSIYENVEEAEVTGGELEILYTPTSNSLISLGVGWVDAEFTDFQTVDNMGNPINFSGNQMPAAPEFTFNGIVQHDFQMGEWLITPQLDWNWRDEYFGDTANTEFLTIGGQTVQTKSDANWDVNLRLTIASAESGLSLTAFVEDIGEDEGDYDFSFLGGNDFGLTFSKFEQPETYGVVLRYEF